MPSAVPDHTGSAPAEEGTWARVLAAARECFVRYGVRKTSMSDIADVAGLARQSVYRYAASKAALVDAALVARLSEMGHLLREIIDGTPGFEEAAVEGSVAVVTAARSDPELIELLSASQGRQVSALTTSSSSAIHRLVAELWHPLFARGRAEGLVREDVGEDQMVEWIQGVYLTLMLRTDLDSDGDRFFVRTFLIRSLRS